MRKPSQRSLMSGDVFGQQGRLVEVDDLNAAFERVSQDVGPFGLIHRDRGSHVLTAAFYSITMDLSQPKFYGGLPHGIKSICLM